MVGSSDEEGGSTSTLKGFRGACVVYRPGAVAPAEVTSAPPGQRR